MKRGRRPQASVNVIALVVLVIQLAPSHAAQAAPRDKKTVDSLGPPFQIGKTAGTGFATADPSNGALFESTSAYDEFYYWSHESIYASVVSTHEPTRAVRKMHYVAEVHVSEAGAEASASGPGYASSVSYLQLCASYREPTYAGDCQTGTSSTATQVSAISSSKTSDSLGASDLTLSITLEAPSGSTLSRQVWVSIAVIGLVFTDSGGEGATCDPITLRCTIEGDPGGIASASTNASVTVTSLTATY